MPRWFKSCLTAAGMMLLATGCPGAGAGDADELLSQSISGLLGEDDIAFAGATMVEMSDAAIRSGFSFTGRVNDHHEINIQPEVEEQDDGYTASALEVSGALSYARVNRQWTVSHGSDKQLHPMFTLNPIIHAEHLNRTAQDVAIVAGEALQEGTIVLRAAVDQEHLLEDVRKLLRSEHERIIAEAREEVRGEDNEQLAAELEQTVQQAEKQLAQILESLRVDSEYRIVVDKRSRRLLELIYTARLRYKLDEQPHEEAIRTSYQFKE